MVDMTYKQKHKGPPYNDLSTLGGCLAEYKVIGPAPLPHWTDNLRDMALKDVLVEVLPGNEAGSEMADLIRRRQKTLRNIYKISELEQWMWTLGEDLKGYGEKVNATAALKLAFALDLEIDEIRLSKSALSGAEKLGLRLHRGRIDMWSLPEDFRVLNWWQVDDFLSLFRNQFRLAMTDTNWE